MTDQITADPAFDDALANPTVSRARLHRRVRHGVKQPHNWIQLIKFGAVGASGYAVNLIAYETARSMFDVHYLAAAVIAFTFAVTNNFLWNRYWTFKASDGHAGFQAARFFVVSLFALAFNLVMLKLLVSAGINEFNAQAIAIICATPLNFVGNKLWSFGS